MSEANTQEAIVVAWEQRVEVPQAAAEAERLKAALDEASAKNASVSIVATDAGDPIARQLIAAARRSAAAAGVTISAEAGGAPLDGEG